MDGDGRFSSPMRPISKSQLTTKKTAWAATSPQRRRTGSTSKAIQFSPQSKQHHAAEPDFRKRLKGGCAMQKYMGVLVLIVGMSLAAMSSFPPNTSRVAAETQQSTAVFDSDGRLKLP